MSDRPFGPIAELKGEDALIKIRMRFAAAVHPLKETALIAERHLDLEDEGLIALASAPAILGRPLVDDEDAEHPCARLKAFKIRRAQFAPEAEADALRDRDALGL